MLEVSLGSSWPKDSLRMDRSGVPEPAGPEILNNFFELYFLHPKNLVQQKVVQHKNKNFLQRIVIKRN